MSRCRGCNKEIDVKWWTPLGRKVAILEDLCSTCLAWAEVAKLPGPLQPPSGKRQPNVSFVDELIEEKKHE